MSSPLPCVFVTVPSVENLETVIQYLCAAGAQITTGRREFVIEGPLTPVQAAATWQLSRHRDSGTEGNRLAVRVEPASTVDAALQVLCREGFDPARGDPRPGQRGWLVAKAAGAAAPRRGLATAATTDLLRPQGRRLPSRQRAPRSVLPAVRVLGLVLPACRTTAPTASRTSR